MLKTSFLPEPRGWNTCHAHMYILQHDKEKLLKEFDNTEGIHQQIFKQNPGKVRNLYLFLLLNSWLFEECRVCTVLCMF